MTPAYHDEAAIRDAAYFLWLNEGQPEGRDQDLWYRAIDALNTPQPKKRATRKAAPKKAAAAKAPAKAKAKPAAKKPRAKATA